MLRCGKIGEGTYGIVYAATTPTRQHEYAVKRNLVEKDIAFIGSVREIDILTKLRGHPGIIRLEQIAFANPFATDAMSPICSKDRSSQKDDRTHFVFSKASYDLHEYTYSPGIKDYGLTKRYMVQILLALEYMHKKEIIHRDLKPGNILIFENEADYYGYLKVAKICDFGLAKPFTKQGEHTPGTFTTWYRPPEVAANQEQYDYKSDVWSLGCLFYEMVAQKPFIQGVERDDDIIAAIVKNSPEKIPKLSVEKLTGKKSMRWSQLTKRISFIDKLKFTEYGRSLFESSAGSLLLFDDLLNNMLRFDSNHRFTVSECLNHNFFKEYANYIALYRKMFPAQKETEPYTIVTCQERNWALQLVTEIFNNQQLFSSWYDDRILFQAIDLYDRYLYTAFTTTKFPPNAVATVYKGLLHEEEEAKLRFFTCLYLCVKYFSSIRGTVRFEEVVPPEFRTHDCKLRAEHFEIELVVLYTKYALYRPTLYEIADTFGDKLTKSQIRELLILYCANPSINGRSSIDIYKYYKENLISADTSLLMKAFNK